MTSYPDTGSRWWYGVALQLVVVGAVWIAWGTVQLLGVESAGTPPSLLPANDAVEIPFLLASVSTVLLIFAHYVLTPVFSMGLYLDSKHVSANNGGRSLFRWIYAAVSVLHLLSLLLPVIQFVTLPAGGVYLINRHK
ncbi:hypothetical protein GL213_09680 [Halogeometricum borinquense]|uniref:Uncharacterized protein n=1 Tax=Halogeometricum borinquense TaxID=60847 RepID=A0A6C0UF92_9EURY|nr:hypothetical protein G3I44_05960 [Halogeometricum borinquense]QIQ76761.1 hypothetical protein GL213_09680 [Halogeometricum borinquense]